MRTEERRHVRAIVRRVHPDLFAAHPQERAINSESLKVRSQHTLISMHMSIKMRRTTSHGSACAQLVHDAPVERNHLIVVNGGLSGCSVSVPPTT